MPLKSSWNLSFFLGRHCAERDEESGRGDAQEREAGRREEAERSGNGKIGRREKSAGGFRKVRRRKSTKFFFCFSDYEKNITHAVFVVYRVAQEEIAALTQMAEQLNSKLAAAKTTSEQSGDSVDLDNLFAFLSDVQTGQNNQVAPKRNHIIDEIGEKMNELVEDLDVEV